MSKLRFSITIFSFLFAFNVLVGAEAQDAQVASDLKTYGGVSRGEARSLIRKVSDQMKKAANSIVGLNDPIRRAIRVGMFGVAQTPQQDAVNDANARLHLYSGLTEQSLRILFQTGPGMLAICSRNFRVSESQCEALVAASVRKPVKEVARLLRGQPAAIPARPVAPAPNYPVAATAPRATYTPTPRPVAAPRPTYQPAPAAQARPTYRPATTNPTSAAATAAAYKARRAKYLASFKKKKEEKQKARDAANAADPIVISNKKTTTEPEVFETPESKTASAAAPAPSPTKTEAPKAKPKPKKTDSFIADLLSDPLGKK